MTREIRRATFNRSALVRVLSETLPEAPDPKYDFGERLGQWLDFSDALTLFSVLDPKAGDGQPHPPSGADLPAKLEGVRQHLGDSIRNDGVFNAGTARIPFPTPLPNASPESTADFSPYHRYYLAHQREMTGAITALRANARKALAAQSSAGRQLADLDAAFEKFLMTKERHLLGNVPILLGKRFNEHYIEHLAALPDRNADDPATWTQSGSWLEAFCHDAQTVLLAELQLRLKPVAGLIAALGSTCDTNHTKPQ